MVRLYCNAVLVRRSPEDSDALGAAAPSPVAYSPRAYRTILRRVWVKNSEHNLSLLAGAVAFYAFLSFVPLMGALVMSYGLFADPASVTAHMRLLIDLIPADAAQLIYSQLTQLTKSAADRKGLGLAVALLVSLYGASRASGAMITALNIVYEEKDRRTYLRWTFVSAALAAGAVTVGIVGLLAASMLHLPGNLFLELGPASTRVVQIISWLLAAGLCIATLAGIYRFAPNRADARWQWLSLGSVVATLLWLVATVGFGVYVTRFGDYDATYGSLGAVVVLLLWLYLSAYAVLLGGLINAETERQTARETTTGRPAPMGQRGATVADMSAALETANPGARGAADGQPKA